MPIKTPLVPVAAEVRQDQESEAALIQRVKQAGSNFSWLVGECASLWTARWAKGRTDADFGNAVGMTGEQVGQRRRVWDRWGGVSDTYPNLSWSHFYAAVSWEDADSCLEWASVNRATVSEMKSWRERKGYVSESVTLGNSGNGQFSNDDPLGERASGTGTKPAGEDGGKETGGTETAEEDSTRPPGSGTEASGGKAKPTKDPYLELKAKAVKTFEAASRVLDDMLEIGPVPHHSEMKRGVLKSIETLKACGK